MAKRQRRNKKAAKRHPKRAAGRARTTLRKARRRKIPARKRSRSAEIDVIFKGRTIALAPPVDNDPDHLSESFRMKLQAALGDLAAQGKPFKLVEGFRTVDRQQWLFGSGRPNATPYGRPGKIVTHKDGVKALSNHQGNGTAGSGKGADCYPLKDGRVHTPPASDPVWKSYAQAVVKQGMKAGLNFPTLKDAPHCELP